MKPTLYTYTPKYTSRKLSELMRTAIRKCPNGETVQNPITFGKQSGYSKLHYRLRSMVTEAENKTLPPNFNPRTTPDPRQSDTPRHEPIIELETVLFKQKPDRNWLMRKAENRGWAKPLPDEETDRINAKISALDPTAIDFRDFTARCGGPKGRRVNRQVEIPSDTVINSMEHLLIPEPDDPTIIMFEEQSWLYEMFNATTETLETFLAQFDDS